jgi:hypothetical protein
LPLLLLPPKPQSLLLLLPSPLPLLLLALSIFLEYYRKLPNRPPNFRLFVHLIDFQPKP